MGIVLTHSAKYKPMSFERLIQPYVMATEEYRTLEKGIADLEGQAATLEQQALAEPENSKTRRQYLAYSEQLKQAASDLASKGLKGVNRKSVLNLNTQYKSNILPIEAAIKAKATDVAKQQEEQKDPTIRFSRNAAETSLDYYLNNNAPTYDRLSGATLAAQTKDLATAISKEFRDNPRKWEKIYGGQYIESRMQKGYTSQEVHDAIYNPDKAPKELVDILNSVIDSSRLSTWDNYYTTDEMGTQIISDYGKNLNDWARTEAGKGLWSAIGDTTYNIQSNKDWESTPSPASPSSPSQIESYQNMSRIPSGVSGTVNKDVLRLEGLRLDNNGNVSTTILGGYVASLNNVKEKLNSLTEDLSNEDIKELKRWYDDDKQPQNKNYSGYTGIAQSIADANANTYKLSAKARRRYLRIKNVIDEMYDYEDKIKQEQEYIKEIANKYSHLGSTLYEQVSNGIKLEDIHEKEQSFRAILNPRNATDNNKAIDAIQIQTEGISEKYDNTDIGMFKVNAKGTKEEKVKAANVKTIMDNTSSISIEKDKDGKFRLLVTSNGVDYRFKNMPEFTRIENTITGVYNFLRGFSKSELGIGSESSTVTVWDPSTEMSPDYNIYQIPGTDYYGAVVYNTATRDYTKHIISPMGNIEYSLSFSQEKQSGKYRDEILGKIINMALQSFLPKK